VDPRKVLVLCQFLVVVKKLNEFRKFIGDMYFFNLLEQLIVVYSLHFVAKAYYESVF